MLLRECSVYRCKTVTSEEKKTMKFSLLFKLALQAAACTVCSQNLCDTMNFQELLSLTRIECCVSLYMYIAVPSVVLLNGLSNMTFSVK